jgi:2-octaprenyl-6-methoxyphenol hydroxylase
MYDLIIVGAGPVGATAAAALSGRGLQLLVLEARHDGRDDDRRSLALSWGSRLILERVGAWGDELSGTPIHSIHVSQRGGFGRALMTAGEAGVPALGYVVSYAALHAALMRRLRACGVRPLQGARATRVDGSAAEVRVRYEHDGEAREDTARLAVIADGGALARSATDQAVRDYRQSAVVANVTTDRPHGNRAFERFSTAGPMALLPFGAGFALVWTTAPDEAQSLVACDERAFLDALQSRFGNRAGRFIAVQGRASYPLALRFARSPAERRVLLLGNAAQTLHPVAGQGLNLGLRDAFELARCLSGAALEDARFAQRFRSLRRADRRSSIAMTDAMIRVFCNDLPGLSWLRGCGLTALDSLPPVKREFMDRMMFGS